MVRRPLLFAIAALVLWLGCGDNKEAPPGPSGPTAIALSDSTATLAIGDTHHVTAHYVDASTAPSPSDIAWSSSDAATVTVTGSGGAVTLTAIAAGSATITASGQGGLSATLSVTVSPAVLLGIATPPQPRLAAGTTAPIVITASYSDGSTTDVTAQATITVDDPSIATIAAGVISGKKKGDTQLHATYSGFEVSTLLTVTDALLVSIAITPANAMVPLGVKPQLTATGTFTDNSMQNLTTQVAWTSSMTSIATIGAATGLVTTVAVGGPTVITATKGTISGTTNLSVIQVDLVSIAVTPANSTVPLGSKPQFAALGTYNDSSTADLTNQATWASDTAATATIDPATGLATTHAQGTATISATFGGITGMTMLTVGPKALATIVVSPANPTVAAGLTQQFTALGTFTDATTADYTALATWASETTAAATIDSGGLATTKVMGSSNITATSGTIVGATLLTVAPAAIASITIAPDAQDLAVGTDFQLHANAVFTDGSTGDVTDVVIWGSTNAAKLPVGANDGVVSALGLVAAGTLVTISAASGAASDTTTVSSHAAAIGTFTANIGTGKTVCDDGVRFSLAGTFAYACFTDAAFQRASIAGTAATWSLPTMAPTSTAGLALVVHQSVDNQVQLIVQPDGTNNDRWLSGDNGANFASMSDNGSPVNTRFIYAGTLRAMVMNVMGSWDPAGNGGAGGAIVLGGANTLPNTRTLGTATGITHAVAATSTSNAWAGVFGQTPSGGAATCGLFHSTDNVGSFTEADNGLTTTDKDLVYALAADANGTTVYAGLQGGGQLYKTVDGGATWAISATGLPRRAKVNALLLSPADVTSKTLYASTNLGLFVSTDAGATWASAGFLGRDVRGAAVNPAGTLLLVGARDNLADGTSGVYSAP